MEAGKRRGSLLAQGRKGATTWAGIAPLGWRRLVAEEAHKAQLNSLWQAVEGLRHTLGCAVEVVQPWQARDRRVVGVGR